MVVQNTEKLQNILRNLDNIESIKDGLVEKIVSPEYSYAHENNYDELSQGSTADIDYIFEIDRDALYLKISQTFDSYLVSRGISKIEFVKPKEIKKVEYVNI